jgi:hypothetical protein
MFVNIFFFEIESGTRSGLKKKNKKVTFGMQQE